MHDLSRHTIRADGIDLAYANGGQGRPVVYLHGALMTLEEGLIGLYPALSADHRMLAFDRPGHGGSGRGPTTGSAWVQAALIHKALAMLGVERPVLIGHSFGGAVAMAYALQFPEAISGVVAVAPIAFPEPRLEQILFGPRAVPGGGDLLSMAASPADATLLLPVLWSGMFLPQAMPDRFKAEFPFDLSRRRAQLRADGEEALWMGADLGRSAMAYAGCRVPVQVLQGDRDAVVNGRLHGRLLAALLPRGRFTRLEGLGHMAHHFRPDAVKAAIDALPS